MNKNIRTYNSKGEYHGYQEWYTPIGKLYLRGNLKNNIRIHYMERHTLKITYYHIK